MPLVVLASAKGGTGKSTLAANLGGALPDAAVIDLDSQGSLSSWVAGRNSAPPLLPPSSLKKPPKRWVLVDTPPRLDQGARDAIAVADLVLIALRPSKLDLDAAATAHAIAQEHGRRRAFVLTMCGQNRLTAMAQEALQPHGLVLGTIGNRVAFPLAWMQGETVLEMEPSGAAALEIRSLASQIRHFLA